MKITAVIPIRTGSQRVKDKNLRAFADTNLMELKIKTLLQVLELILLINEVRFRIHLYTLLKGKAVN